MKKFKLSSAIFVLSLFSLCACSEPDFVNKGGSNEDPVTPTPVVPDDNTDDDDKKTDEDDSKYNNIDEFKATANIDDTCLIKGVIAGFQKNSDGNSGAFIVGKTGSIYVFSTRYFNDCSIGDEVEVAGTFSRYISTTEASAGEAIGWSGGRQIKADSVTVLNENVDYKSYIGETTIRDVVNSDYTINDISSNVYKAACKITVAAQTGFTNYYFYDESLDYSVYAYSTLSGADYTWLSTYNEEVHYVYFGVQGLRPKDQVWRIIPLSVESEKLSTDYSDEKKAEFALNKLEDQFESEYKDYGPVDLVTDYEGIEGETITYESSNGLISDSKTLTIDTSKFTGEASITIKVTYNDKEYTRVVTFNVVKGEEFSYKTVSEVLNAEEGEEVYVKGIYARFTANNAGLYLLDNTGILQVNYSPLINDSLVIGEELVMKGIVTKKFAIEDGSYAGHNTLAEGTLISHDGAKHDFYTNVVAGETTVSEIYDKSDKEAMLAKIGKIYTVRGIASIVKTNYYSNYRFYSEDKSSYLTLYCSSASQLSWLDEYQDTLHEYYIYIRDSKTGDSLRVELLDIIA